MPSPSKGHRALESNNPTSATSSASGSASGIETLQNSARQTGKEPNQAEKESKDMEDKSVIFLGLRGLWRDLANFGLAGVVAGILLYLVVYQMPNFVNSDREHYHQYVEEDRLQRMEMFNGIRGDMKYAMDGVRTELRAIATDMKEQNKEHRNEMKEYWKTTSDRSKEFTEAINALTRTLKEMKE